MADYSFLTDSDDEKAVEDLLSQAINHSVLEQVSKISCSSFSSDSPLPSHLESRVRKLKSFPSTIAAAHHQKCVSALQISQTPIYQFDSSQKPFSKKCLKTEPEVELKPKSRSSTLKSKSGKASRSFQFASKNSPTWSSGSSSPPRKSDCFWCSPKKNSEKKRRENRFPGIGLDWGKDDDLLSDLSNCSIKEQQKIVKKTMIEEEKINREAEKIVKWAKQASVRMNVSGLE